MPGYLRLSGLSLLVLVILNSGRADAIEVTEVFRIGDYNPYVQANFTGSFTNLDSGGFNTAGFFTNSNHDTDSNVGFGGTFGLMKEHESFRIRPEFEAMWRQDAGYVTDSFPGPPGPISFFYDVQSSDNWSTLANLWLDAPIAEHLWLYGGGGIGAAGMHLSVTDNVVSGETTASNFAWQAGAGFIVPVSDNFEIDLGYRFLDMGTASIALDGGSSGDYLADLVSHNLMFSVRLYVP